MDPFTTTLTTPNSISIGNAGCGHRVQKHFIFFSLVFNTFLTSTTCYTLQHFSLSCSSIWTYSYINITNRCIMWKYCSSLLTCLCGLLRLHNTDKLQIIREETFLTWLYDLTTWLHGLSVCFSFSQSLSFSLCVRVCACVYSVSECVQLAVQHTLCQCHGRLQHLSTARLPLRKLKAHCFPTFHQCSASQCVSNEKSVVSITFLS